jgi:hypothetical protein
MTERFVEIENSHRLFVRDWGAGKPVVRNPPAEMINPCPTHCIWDGSHTNKASTL